MDFFYPRQRSFFYEDPWEVRQHQNQQRRLRQQIQGQRQKNFIEVNKILDDQHYYDPLFGNIFPIRRSELPTYTDDNDCDCINCQMERYTSNKTRGHQIQRGSPKPSTIPRESEYGDTTSDESSSDGEDSCLQSPPVLEASDNLTEKKDATNNKIADDQDEDQLKETTREDEERNDGENDIETETDEIKRKIMLIEEVRNDLEQIKQKIDKLSGDVKDKEYLYCEEMLTKYLLRLDDILAEGVETIRQARKKVVNEINNALKTLEEKCLREE